MHSGMAESIYHSAVPVNCRIRGGNVYMHVHTDILVGMSMCRRLLLVRSLQLFFTRSINLVFRAVLSLLQSTQMKAGSI